MSILARIRSNGGDVTRNGFVFRFIPGQLDSAARQWVKDHIDDVKREVWPLYDDWQERAAIMEFDGGMSRQDAERAAYDCVEGAYARAA